VNGPFEGVAAQSQLKSSVYEANNSPDETITYWSAGIVTGGARYVIKDIMFNRDVKFVSYILDWDEFVIANVTNVA
jgi:hypothetical protein